MKNANMRKIIFSMAVIVVSFIFMSNSSCSHSKKNKHQQTHEREIAIKDSIARRMQEDYYLAQGYEKAIVTDNIGLDGCRFMLQLESGKKLEPTNLAAEYTKDGLKVWVKYQLVKNAMSICMAGEIVQLTNIEKRE